MRVTFVRHIDWKVFVEMEYPRPSTGVVPKLVTRLSWIIVGPEKRRDPADNINIVNDVISINGIGDILFFINRFCIIIFFK